MVSLLLDYFDFVNNAPRKGHTLKRVDRMQYIVHALREQDGIHNSYGPWSSVTQLLIYYKFITHASYLYLYAVLVQP